MPSNNLASVGLPYRGTGAAAKKPYVEFYGNYKKGKLTLSLTGEGKGTKTKEYEYVYDFKNGKESTTTPVDLLVLRLDKKSYFVGDKLLFDVYKEAGVINVGGCVAVEGVS